MHVKSLLAALPLALALLVVPSAGPAGADDPRVRRDRRPPSRRPTGRR